MLEISKNYFCDKENILDVVLCVYQSLKQFILYAALYLYFYHTFLSLLLFWVAQKNKHKIFITTNINWSVSFKHRDNLPDSIKIIG